MTLMLGFSLLAHDPDVGGFVDTLAPDGSVLVHTPLDDRQIDYRAGLSWGIDVPFRLTARITMVPQLRVHQLINGDFGEILPSGYRAIRPGFAVRWDMSSGDEK